MGRTGRRAAAVRLARLGLGLWMAGMAGLAAGCGDGDGGGGGDGPKTTAPDNLRVDKGVPSFANPTVITNARFPVSRVTQAILLGTEGDDVLRFEVTLLPGTKQVQWDGKAVTTVVSSFVGYTNGRIAEVASDFFAQADDGAVWYFGEDVANYRDGALADNGGTWLAGRDGPPGMIMPADPKVGNVYRPENIPGLVFEEVTVKAVGEAVEGPRGRVEGSVKVQENLMEGTLEDKVFAPGYGEFEARVESEDEHYTLALAVPTDAVAGAVPAPLTAVSAGVGSFTDPSLSRDDAGRLREVEQIEVAWKGYDKAPVPALLRRQMNDALAALRKATEAKKEAERLEAALAVGHASLDLQLQHRPPAEVDRDRLGLWATRVGGDSAAADDGAVAGDVVALDAIWARAGHALGPAQAGAERALVALRSAVKAKDRKATQGAAADLRAAVAGP